MWGWVWTLLWNWIGACARRTSAETCSRRRPMSEQDGRSMWRQRSDWWIVGGEESALETWRGATCSGRRTCLVTFYLNRTQSCAFHTKRYAFTERSSNVSTPGTYTHFKIKSSVVMIKKSNIFHQLVSKQMSSFFAVQVSGTKLTHCKYKFWVKEW